MSPPGLNTFSIFLIGNPSNILILSIRLACTQFWIALHIVENLCITWELHAAITYVDWTKSWSNYSFFTFANDFIYTVYTSLPGFSVSQSDFSRILTLLGSVRDIFSTPYEAVPIFSNYYLKHDFRFSYISVINSSLVATRKLGLTMFLSCIDCVSAAIDFGIRVLNGLSMIQLDWLSIYFSCLPYRPLSYMCINGLGSICSFIYLAVMISSCSFTDIRSTSRE